MAKPALHLAFCAIVFTAVFATCTSDNPVTAENTLRNSCSRWELSLNVSNAILSHIGKNFITSPLITCLSLNGNEINSVEKGAFDSLPALEYLNMAGNSISPLMSFGGHENLRVLILANQIMSRNNYDWLRRDLLITGTYPKLESLDLSGTTIQSFNLNMEYNNRYEDTEMQIYDAFPELTYLDLSNNNIEQFIPSAEQFVLLKRNLTHLYLHRNYIHFANLTHLENLIVLTLDNNNIEALRRNSCTSLSLCLGDTSMLKYFSVATNNLIHIDEDFFNTMPQLVSLNLSNNRLQNSLHGIFDNLISLEDLSIDDNKLTNVSISNHRLNIQNLSLISNNIEYIDSNDLRNLPSLRKLYLNNNRINGIHKNAFLELEMMEELHLANNNLTDLPADWSANLRNLRYLDLTNNAFMYLESLSLSDTLPQIDIYLINNKFLTLKATSLNSFSGNVTIYLTDDRRKEQNDSSVCQDS